MESLGLIGAVNIYFTDYKDMPTLNTISKYSKTFSYLFDLRLNTCELNIMEIEIKEGVINA